MPSDKQVIATRDLILHNDGMGINQKVFAGQPVPPDLVKAYHAEVGSGDEPASDTADAKAEDSSSADVEPDKPASRRSRARSTDTDE